MARADRTPRQRLAPSDRRGAIVGAARALYGSRPYAEVSVHEVAEAAGASTALVFHYFGSKPGLYTAVVADTLTELADAQQEADAALPPSSPSRDHVRASLEVYLDHVAAHPVTWAWPLRGGVEPVEAQEVRRDARAESVQDLSRLLGFGSWTRHRYALAGYYGFVDEVCLAWVDRGCPVDEREPLVAAALGALEGALGDWGS